MNAQYPSKPAPVHGWQRFASNVMRGFHVYASWLVSITWTRFVLLSLLLLIATSILQDLPPFTWRIDEHVEEVPAKAPKAPKAPPAAKPAKPAKAEKPAKPGGPAVHYDVTIDERGIRVLPRGAASAPEGAASDASRLPSIRIDLPSSVDKEAIKDAVEEARQAVEDALDEKRGAIEQAQQALEEKQRALEEMQATEPGTRRRVRVVRIGDFLVQLSFLLILASVIIKITYKGRIQAEVKAAQATETAEAESLKRQVVEARMAAMQAQVEPHFLFNTLASIDHLIETDPPRASIMQKNLIALLRASMPTMREANATGVRDLGRELAVIKPYLEILKVRMEERLVTDIQVPEGLLSAEFPPMMIQSLVENAIKHGLEPKAEGGTLTVKAEIVHGKLCVTVADTGLGFGKAATAGTGVGLANIRERLQLLYGNKATLAVTENSPSGTVVSISVPYSAREGVFA
nr:histidine kinase [uncultured Roseateles sp.]